MSAPILYRFKQNPIVNGWSYYFTKWGRVIHGARNDVFIVLTEDESTATILSKYGVRWVYKDAIEVLK